ILDAGCGTGRHLEALQAAGARGVGLDFAPGMLAASGQRVPGTPRVLADLLQPLPLATGTFDAVLSALIGEHLEELGRHFAELVRVLRPGGRLVFSVYHPWLAAAGKEANFQLRGVEYRLGAFAHTLEDYRAAMVAAGLGQLQLAEFHADDELAAAVPPARKYLGRALLVIFSGVKNATQGPEGGLARST
ncbi:MAG TPA: class I SAM-dependent methyltransferase, partial [Thermoanaerobaculia bacterium]|nr:class I SAM-dependent methyltransferase [Thermoanaerobaculia bacterium]